MDDQPICDCGNFRPFSAIQPMACACGRPATAPFQNSRYEYTTREVPTTNEVISGESDRVMQSQGWRRCWADVTIEGTFVVYRRARAE
jgi:hypothetical protein